MKISSFGADNTVTGSMHLIESNEGNFIVDAGMFQGQEAVEKRNLEDVSFNPSAVKAIFLTHAHYDHCGRIPYLYKKGFRGKIFASKETRKLAQIILNDAVNIMEIDGDPLYGEVEVTESLLLFEDIKVGERKSFQNIKFEFGYAGHILGACWLYLHVDNKRVLFSGDLGRDDDLLMKLPQLPEMELDLVIIESTYGNRVRSELNPEEEFKKLLKRVIGDKKVWMIPSFAMARTQNLMALFYKIMNDNPSLEIPVWVTSPMAELVTEVYRESLSELKDSELFENSFQFVRFAHWFKQIDKLDEMKGPVILISSSGMLNGGRIQRIIKHHGGDKNNLLTIVGYQGEGTLGRKILDGLREFPIDDKMKFRLESEVIFFDSFSAHADAKEIKEWLVDIKTKRVHIVHGENQSQLDIKSDLEKMGLEVTTATESSSFELN